MENAIISIIDFEESETTIINTDESHAYFFVASLVAENSVPTNIPNAKKTKWPMGSIYMAKSKYSQTLSRGKTFIKRDS